MNMSDYDNDHPFPDSEGGLDLLPEAHEEVKEPPMYRIVLHNDDFTPRDFVVNLLIELFGKSRSEATQIMLKVHHSGAGVVGIYPFEIAETKTFQVNEVSRKNQFPLKCTFEEAE